MPELDGATEWVNGIATREALAGKPTLIHFWALSCHICHDNMPTVQRWRAQYADRGLQVVGVHMPRQQEDTDPGAVKAAIAEMGIVEPCAIDNNHLLGEAFQNQYWPAYFVFDATGELRGRALACWRGR